MAGRLVTIEGTDGSGKSTQFDLLCARLEARGVPFLMQRFPRYESESAALLKLYLGGHFGGDPSAVNAYAASSFFAADRFAAFHEGLRAYYDAGGLILCDRYTPSNAIHQASKLAEAAQLPFCDWLFDYEYRRLGLPEPDLVLFLDMPETIAAELIRQRAEAAGSPPDIHERDSGYLRRCREAALRIAGRYGFRTVTCADGGAPRAREEVARDIEAAVLPLIPKPRLE